MKKTIAILLIATYLFIAGLPELSGTAEHTIAYITTEPGQTPMQPWTDPVEDLTGGGNNDETCTVNC